MRTQTLYELGRMLGQATLMLLVITLVLVTARSVLGGGPGLLGLIAG